jgi:ribosomal protein S18 acetylase RimI-like enzyme
MSRIDIRDGLDAIDIDLAYRWLAATYWGASTSRETFDRAVANSFCVAGFVDGVQLGFVRAVTDYATFAWVSDVVVDTEARGRGLGRAMVAHMLTHPRLQGLRRWNLNTRDAHGVYEPLGFTVAAEQSAYMERLEPGYAAAVTPAA